MGTRLMLAVTLTLLTSASLFSQAVTGPMIRFRTTLGDIDVNLLPDSAPQTVANFLRYVNRGAFNNSIFHRSVANFIIQGGGFTFANGAPVDIASDPPVRNEYAVSNLRGTLAMAKLGSDPNSATNQWFFNLRDNSANLNNQNGGFTVFGRVANAAGLLIMDRIAAVPVFNLGSAFESLPLVNYRTGAVQAANLVTVTSIVQVSAAAVPAIRSEGIISVSGFGGFASAAPGSFIEIYGSDLSATTRGWEDRDFSDGRAPTALDEVRVTVDGKAAYVSYVSPGQINAQVPADVTTGTTVEVVVTNRGQASASAPLLIKPLAPGLLAPANFRINDRQYVVAVRGNGTFVSSAEPATRGETLTLYGVGFGPVDPNTVPIAGQTVNAANNLASAVRFDVGGSPAQVAFAGLVSGLVGLYQFNVTIPNTAAAGDQVLAVSVGGESLTQILYLPVAGN